MDARQLARPVRLAAIDELPNVMQDAALVDWKTVAVLLGRQDIQEARRIVVAADLPLVQVSARRKLPRWGDLREWLKSRETERPAAA